MDLALALLAVASVALGIWDLVRTNAGDVLRTAALLEVGFLMGALGQLVVPGGFVLGALAGLGLGFAHFDRLVEERVLALDAQLISAPDEATSLLTLHDRIDALSRPGNGVRQAGVFLALLFMLLFGVGLIAVGLTTGVWTALLVGSLVLFTPLAQGTRLLAEFEERRSLRSRLADTRWSTGDLLDSPGV